MMLSSLPVLLFVNVIASEGPVVDDRGASAAPTAPATIAPGDSEQGKASAGTPMVTPPPPSPARPLAPAAPAPSTTPPKRVVLDKQLITQQTATGAGARIAGLPLTLVGSCCAGIGIFSIAKSLSFFDAAERTKSDLAGLAGASGSEADARITGISMLGGGVAFAAVGIPAVVGGEVFLGGGALADAQAGEAALEADDETLASLAYARLGLYEAGAAVSAFGVGALASGVIASLVGSILLSNSLYEEPGDAAVKDAVEGLPRDGVPCAVIGGVAATVGLLLCGSALGVEVYGSSRLAATDRTEVALPSSEPSDAQLVRY